MIKQHSLRKFATNRLRFDLDEELKFLIHFISREVKKGRKKNENITQEPNIPEKRARILGQTMSTYASIFQKEESFENRKRLFQISQNQKNTTKNQQRKKSKTIGTTSQIRIKLNKHIKKITQQK